MDVEKYLQKINCTHLKEVSLKNLSNLQKSHLRKIPFENFDMHMNKSIDFSLEKSYDQIVNNPRGGYCIQLNCLFGWLLKKLGYDVWFIPAFFFNQTLNSYFKLPIHLILIVNIENKKYYVDVGTSRVVVEPFEIIEEKIQKRLYGFYRFKCKDKIYEFERKSINQNAQWIPTIKFKLEPKEFEYFREMNDYVQTDLHPSIFYRTIAVLSIENGIRYLIGNRYTEIVFGENFEENREDRILSIEDVRKCIKEKFGIILPDIEFFKPVDNLDQYFATLGKNHS